MTPFEELCAFDEAWEIAVTAAEPLRGTERLTLECAAGRVAAVGVPATVDVPAYDRAAMDGFAIRAEEVVGAGDSSPVFLRCVGRVAAGDAADVEVGEGTCVEVATGAPVPPGADAVVPVERTRIDGDRVEILSAAGPGDHVSTRGEDMAAGATVVEAGSVLTPARIAALASVGVQEVDVWRRPRVAIVSTGDEVVPLGRELERGQVYDSNRHGLAALLQEAGAMIVEVDPVPDESGGLRRALTREEIDMVITIAGSSVGRRDLVASTVAGLGQVSVHGVAVKPGKPVLVGRVEGRPVLGLPGFPTSCLLMGYVFAEPMVRRMGRLPTRGRRRLRATLSEDVRSPVGKRHFVTVTLEDGRAEPVFTYSSAITSMSRADGWFEIDADVGQLRAGVDVEVVLF